MDLRGIYSKVDHSRPPSCVSEEIFRRYLRGESDFQEFLEMTSIQVSNDASRVRPIPYPVIHPSLKDYVSGRLAGRCEHDDVSGRRLGLWVYSVIKIEDTNSTELRSLLWALEKLQSVNLPKPKEIIQAAINLFALTPLPAALLRDATECQKLDALARISRTGKQS